MKKTVLSLLFFSILISLTACALGQARNSTQSNQHTKTSKQPSESKSSSTSSDKSKNTASSSSSSSVSSAIPKGPTYKDGSPISKIGDDIKVTLADGREVHITAESTSISYPNVGKILKQKDGYFFAIQGHMVLVRDDGQYVSITSEGRTINNVAIDPTPVDQAFAAFGISSTAEIDSLIQEIQTAANQTP